MGECSGCDQWKDRYENLLYSYRNRGNRIYELESKIGKIQNNLDSAECRIHNELEPRIKQEQKNYDNYVLSDHGDECYNNGMNGHCGFECSIFGDRAECFENIKSEEEILNIYENYVSDGYILELVEEYGLQEKAKEIDREILRKQINKHKEEIKKLENEFMKI